MLFGDLSYCDELLVGLTGLVGDPPKPEPFVEPEPEPLFDPNPDPLFEPKPELLLDPNGDPLLDPGLLLFPNGFELVPVPLVVLFSPVPFVAPVGVTPPLVAATRF